MISILEITDVRDDIEFYNTSFVEKTKKKNCDSGCILFYAVTQYCSLSTNTHDAYGEHRLLLDDQ